MKRIILGFLILLMSALIIGNASVKKDTGDIAAASGETAAKQQKFLTVPEVCQYPELPTGCESVSAVMVLRYYGINVSPSEFARDWLESDEEFYTFNGRRYGPNPNEVFVGDPFKETSYGCFEGPIVNAVNNNCSACIAKPVKCKTLAELCENFIDNNVPVIIWATMGMRAPKEGQSWYFKDNTMFSWTSGEHCLVLIGYDDRYYYFNDPMSGGSVAYSKETAQKRFAEMGCRAVCIEKG